MLAWIRKIARVEDDEFDLVRSLFLLHFFIVFAFTLAKAARDGLFLGELPARSLPYVYLGLAVWTWAAVAVFGRVTGRLSSNLTLVGILVWNAAVLLLFFTWFRFAGRAPAVIFYLWTGVWGLLLVSQFWILFNELVDERQARRFIGLIGAGGILGGMAGGGVASTLGSVARPEWLLVAAAGLQVAVAPFWRRQGRRVALRVSAPGSPADGSPSGPPAAAAPAPAPARAPALPASRPSRHAPRPDAGVDRLWRQPYLRLLMLVFLVGGMTSAIIDYQFKLVIQGRLVGAEQITAFLGSFYGMQSLVALVLQVLVARFALSHFGARTSAMLLPAGLLVGATATIGLLTFVPIVATRLYDTTLRISLARSAWEFLYFPLADSVRRQAKRVMEMVVNRGAEAGAGLLVLALNALLGGTVLQLSVTVVVLGTAWLVLELLLNRSYEHELARSLRRMVPRGRQQTLDSQELSLASGLYPLLTSRYETRVLYAVELLDKLDPKGLEGRIPELLRHPSAHVRARVLQMAADLQGGVDVHGVEPLLEDPDDEVRMQAVYVFCQHGPGDPLEAMARLLRSEQEPVRSGALQCVASHAPPEQDDQLESLAREFLERGAPADRRAVALAAGRRAAPTALHRHLSTLVHDPGIDVRRAAVRSAGMAGLRSLVPVLIERLAVREERDGAEDALARYGERVIGTLRDYLTDPGVDLEVRRRVPAVLAAAATQEAASALLAGLEVEDAGASYQALKALNRVRNRSPEISIPVPPVAGQMRRETRLYLRLLLHRKTISAAPAGAARDLLLRAIGESADRALERLFRGMALVYPPREMFLAYRGTTSAERRLRAQAIEYLETMLATEHRQLVLPLIDHPELPSGAGGLRRTSYSRLRRASLALGVRVMTFSGTLADLAGGDDRWLRCCALYAIGTYGARDLMDVARAAGRAADPGVREMGAWARARLDGRRGADEARIRNHG